MLSNPSLQNLQQCYESQDGKTRVYSAYHRIRQKEVAIKEIMCGSELEADAYVTEGTIMMQARHPHICECYTVNKEPPDPTKPWRVLLELEKVDRDLNQEILERARTSDYFPEAEALQFLLDLNLAHRDIKPHNIFVTEDYQLKLGDFGSSRKVEEQFAIYTMQGTPFYMSPKIREAYSHYFANPDVKVEHDVYKSDVFSLGITMLHLITLNPPHSLIYLDRLQNRIDLAVDAVSNYSPGLTSLLRVMLVVEESQRPDFLDLLKLIDESHDYPVAIAENCCCQCGVAISAETPGAVWMQCRDPHGFCSDSCADQFIDQHTKGNIYLCPHCGSRNAVMLRHSNSPMFEELGQVTGKCSGCSRTEQVFSMCHPLCFACTLELLQRKTTCEFCRKPLPSLLLQILSAK